MHERSVTRQRYENMQQTRREDYAAAKAADPQAVAAYEKAVEARRKK